MSNHTIQHHREKQKSSWAQKQIDSINEYFPPTWKSLFCVLSLIVLAIWMLWTLLYEFRTVETFSCNWEDQKCYIENAKDGVFLTYNLDEISHAEALEKKNCYKKYGESTCSTTYYTALALMDGSKRPVYECGGLMFKCQPYITKINNFLSGKEKELVLHDGNLELAWLLLMGFFCIPLLVFIWLVQHIVKKLQKKEFKLE